MEENNENFFKIHRIVLIVIGLWNPKDLPKNKKRVYALVCRFRELMAGWFIICRAIAAILFIINQNWRKLMNNLLFTLTIIIIPVKYILCRSETMHQILVEAERSRREWSYNNFEAKQIYKLYKTRSLKFSLSYLLYCAFGATVVLGSALIAAKVKAREGETDIDILIFSAWIPYDRDDHPFLFYGIDALGVFFSASLYAVADFLLFGLFSFGIANFMVLQNNLRFSKIYIERMQIQKGISFREAEILFIEENIQRHRTAIRFFEKLDREISLFVIVDFLSISIKLSILIYQLINDSNENFFKTHRLVLIIIGLWNPKDLTKQKRLIYECYSRFRELIVAWFTFCRVLAAIIFFYKQNWKSLMNNLLFTLTITIIPIKYFLCRSNEMYEILVEAENIRREWSFNNLEVTKIYNLNKTRTLKFSLTYVIYCCIGSTVVVVSTFIAAGIKARAGETDIDILVLSAWIPYDRDDHPFLYYGLDALGVLYSASAYGVADLLLFGLFAIGIANFMVLQNNMRFSKNNIERIMMERGIPFREAEIIFIEQNVNYHRTAIRFFEKLDRAIAFFVIFDFCSISIKLSILIYQIINELTMFLEYVSVITLTIAIAVELFAYYWYANEIQLQSGYFLREAIFDSDFDEFSPDTRKKLAFMIQRAQKPSHISIGSFYTMNIDTLIKVLKAIYSYICLFNKAKEGI